MSNIRKKDRLDAWYDGSAICVVAIGARGDPLDLSEEEVAGFIEKLQSTLEEARRINRLVAGADKQEALDVLERLDASEVSS